MPSGKPKNEAEGLCFDKLTEGGWDVSKKGWPDFFCMRDGEIIAVEVKRHRGQRLKKPQVRVLRALVEHGIPCYRFDGDSGKFYRLAVLETREIKEPEDMEDCSLAAI